MIVSSVMTDHPSWHYADSGDAYRAARRGDSVWALTSTAAGLDDRKTTAEVVTGEGDPPVVDVVDPAVLTGTDAVVAPLKAAGPVARWQNPDVWDALATAIVRQVIRAGQARKLYRAFSRAHGEQVTTPLGETWLFPTPQTVLDLPEAEFTRLGMAFKRRPLQAAAHAFLEFGRTWAELDPATLVTEVQAVPRIGPWTAGASIADLTNDYALYPFADLAVRTWAKRLAPHHLWPDTEPEFAAAWRRLAGNQLSTWTLLTLAWGVHHAAHTGAAAI